MKPVLSLISVLLIPASLVLGQTRYRQIQSVGNEDSGSVGILKVPKTLLFGDLNVFGEISFTHGLNVGHSVMAIGPNAQMNFEGPAPIDPRYDFGMLAIESNWIPVAGQVWDEFYFTTSGQRRVLGASRDVTNGLSSILACGYLLIDGTQNGMRNREYNPALSIFDNQTTLASISIKNFNPTSTGAQLILGAGFYDATGWSLQHDPYRNGTQAFAIVNRSSNTFPVQIDQANRISLGFTSMHTATKPVEFADPKAAREGLNIYSKCKNVDLGRTDATASADPDLIVTLEPGTWKVSADLFFMVSGGNPGFWAYFNPSGGNVSRGWCRWTFPDSTGGASVKTYTFGLLGNNTGAYQSIGPATGTGGYYVKGESILSVTSTTSLQLIWGQWSPQNNRTTTLIAPSCIVATKVD